MHGTCESCGTDDDLVAVVRLYVTPREPDPRGPQEWDGTEVVTEAGEERWCFSCRSHYAHRLAGEPA